MASSPMMTLGTENTSQASVSRLPTSTPSSPPSGGSNDGDKSTRDAGPVRVSEAMLDEEKTMEDAAMREEEQRQRKFQAQREDEFNAGEQAIDPKFKRLEFLLKQSKVYSSILMAKIQQQRDNAKDTEQRQESKQKPTETGRGELNSEATNTRKSTRGAAATNNIQSDAQSKKKEIASTKKIPSRAKSKKVAGSGIAAYFKKEDLEATSGNTSIAEALEEAVGEQEANPSKLGAEVTRSANQPELVTGGIMRGYQLEGLEWLKSLYENGLNGILADEMGLGKTVQTISFLAFLRSKRSFGPFLIAAPLSTLSNWVEEFARWTPDIPVVLYHGLKQEREVIRQSQLSGRKDEKFPVVCTSYEICMNDRNHLANMGWKFIIIDEGHRLKNFNCRLIRELKSYDSANRLLITGTPLQNNLSELWSLLNFLMPEIFDQLESFESWFDFSALKEKDGHKQILVGERKNHVISSLHAILKPFLLRRVKADVETSLPKKREYMLYAPLTTTQKELYRQILEGNSRAYLQDKVVERMTASGTCTPKGSRSASLKRKAESGTSTPNKSAKSSRASTPASGGRSLRGTRRKDYSEPKDSDSFVAKEEHHDSEELDEDEQEALERAKTVALAKKEIANKKLQNPVMQLRLACNSPHNFYWPWENDETPDDSLITESGKMMLMNRLVPALFERGHKVLVFSQFKTQLDIIEDWATLINGWKVCRIDGQVKQDDRRTQIKSFNTDPEFNLFLLSTRAGGQGINLAAADTVILFDSDWNPQQDLQAQDRAHRIGQTRPVIVYRLATKGTVEQTLLEKADGKRRLEKLVIQKGKFRSLMGKGGEDEAEELQRILTQDDFEKYDIGGEGIFSERDLDVLMDRSEEAYSRAEKGLDGGDGFRVVEMKQADNILADVSST
ncbi:MAG: hypothetical protein M1832_001917 [Thelocarpon impressellum]|nr:MAG: hypothetical protein M1832_001917 [Thelocarpon impressellum]